MKKILLSLSLIVAVGAVAVGATTAFYNDTETSSGNVLAAGAIDLGIDNESYYNGELNKKTSWELDYDLDKETNPDGLPRLFFNFKDLKPGDWGEDTISLHVKDNDSWLCADIKLTSDDDNDVTEPEDDEPLELDTPLTDPDTDNTDGELADNVNFYWWADDGDNVYETCQNTQDPNCVSETLLPAGPMGNLSVGQTATVTLADSQTNIWTGTGAFKGNSKRYIGKAWCFGDTTFDPYPQDGLGSGNNNNSPIQRPVQCNGSNENNITQTDSFTADITFRAVQSRNNGRFLCKPGPIVGG